MVHKNKLGPVLTVVNGLHTRFIEKGEKHFGIYPGKRFYRVFSTKESAESEAQRCTPEKPMCYPFRKAFLKWKETK